MNSTFASDCSHGDGSFNCVDFVRNYDGDTVVVDIPEVHSFFGTEISVRIRGIDTGEVKNHSGRTQCEFEMAHLAKNEVERIFENANEIELRDVERGKYFRVLADIYVNKRSVANHLIRKGLAVSYNGGDRSHTNWCKIQEQAKKIQAQEVGVFL